MAAAGASLAVAAGAIPAAVTGAVMAAGAAIHEGASAEGAVATLVAGGARQSASGVVLAEVIFPVPLAEAIFPHPIFRAVISQDPRAHRDPAEVASQPAARSALRPALAPRPAAEQRNSHRPIDQGVDLDLGHHKSPPPAPSHLAETPQTGPVTNLPNSPLKDLATFSAQPLGLALAPLLAPRSAIVRVSSRPIGQAPGKLEHDRSSDRTGVNGPKTATVNGAIGSITAAKPGTNGANSGRRAAMISKRIGTNVGISWKVRGKIARNGATNGAKIGSNIVKSCGTTGPTARMRFGTMRRTSTMTSSTMRGGVIRAGAVTGPVITHSTPGGGGARPPGVR